MTNTFSSNRLLDRDLQKSSGLEKNTLLYDRYLVEELKAKHQTYL